MTKSSEWFINFLLNIIDTFAAILALTSESGITRASSCVTQ